MKVVFEKSLKLNMILNAIKGMMSIVFPLISFPYVSKVVGVDNLGRYNFSVSVISYFILLAGLGINTYAIREGAKIRENRNVFEMFADQMFTINMSSTIVSYFILFTLITSVEKLQDYRILLLILSLQIMANTLGVDWVYSIYEDYLYITVRSIVFQALTVASLFIFVKSENDLVVYTVLSVLASVATGITNHIRARKYCVIKVVKNVDWKKHLRPIFVLFAMSLTVTVYVSSDTTLLGFICDDHTVGIYAVSTKIYSIVKTILASVLIVSIPRLSAILGQNNRKMFCVVASDIYRTLITVLIPAITGIIVLRREIVSIISTNEFISATSSLLILSVALFFCLGAWFWGQCILVPMNRENTVFKITVVSAVANILFNFILIPFWKENAAAFTTLFAEGISFVGCSFYGKKMVQLSGIEQTFFKVAIGCMGIVGFAYAVNLNISDLYLRTSVTIIGSIIVYFVIQVMLRNEAIWSIINSIQSKFVKS